MVERKNLESVEEAVGEMDAVLAEAVKSGKWMVAVWKAEGEEATLINRITWDFPTNKLLVCSDLLRDDCKGEVETKPMAAFGTPLQRAMKEALGGRSNPCEPDKRIPFGIVNTDDDISDGHKQSKAEKEVIFEDRSPLVKDVTLGDGEPKE